MLHQTVFPCERVEVWAQDYLIVLVWTDQDFFIREVCKSPGGLGPNEEGGRVQGVKEGSTAVQQKAGVLEGGRVALTH